MVPPSCPSPRSGPRTWCRRPCCRRWGGRRRGDDGALPQWLGDRALLLVLDNFEHLLPAAPVIADLLDACARLTVLVTSRVPLRLSGEQTYLVPPLSLPDMRGSVAPEDALRSDAVRLFIQRAGEAGVSVASTPDILPTIGAICQRVDGLPLAIELAAARVTHLSPGALLDRLDAPDASRLPLLTRGPRDQPARQQTMRDALAWSVDLLDEAEQRLFQDLSVFAGGCTLEAAEVIGDEDEPTWREPVPPPPRSHRPAPSPPTGPPRPPASILDLLASLVEHSLVQYEGDARGAPRYTMLETIREFAQERLAASGREATMRSRHAGWCLAFAERAGPQARGPNAAAWLKDLEREHANLRAALAWLAERGDGGRLLRLAGALWPFWQDHAHYREGRRWLELALDLGREAPAADRLRALHAVGAAAWSQADTAQALDWQEQTLSLAREMGDRPAEIWALINLAPQATELGDYDRAIACCEAGFALARAEGNPAAMVLALHNLAIVALQRGEPATARDRFEAALALAREHGVAWLVPINLVGLGVAAMDLGDYPRAAACLREGLELGRAGENLGDVIDAIEGLARLGAALGQGAPATRLFGATAAIRDEIGRPLSPAESGHVAPVLDALQDGLGAEGFAAAWAAGRTLSQDEAIDGGAGHPCRRGRHALARPRKPSGHPWLDRPRAGGAAPDRCRPRQSRSWRGALHQPDHRGAAPRQYLPQAGRRFAGDAHRLRPAARPPVTPPRSSHTPPAHPGAAKTTRVTYTVQRIPPVACAPYGGDTEPFGAPHVAAEAPGSTGSPEQMGEHDDDGNANEADRTDGTHRGGGGGGARAGRGGDVPGCGQYQGGQRLHPMCFRVRWRPDPL